MFAAHTLFGGGEQVFDGRSAILFATVAGVSLGLITGGAHPPPPGDRGDPRFVVLIRGSVLVLLGLAMTAFLHAPIAVILDYYGVAFLLLIPMLFLPRPALALLALLIAVVAPPLVAAVTGAVPFEAVIEPAQIFARWLFHGEYPVLIWLAFPLTGLMLARSDLRARRTATVALGCGALAAALGYGAALVIPGVVADAHSGTTAEVIGSGGVAVAIIGLLCLLDSASGVGERIARAVRVVLSPLAAAGAMAFTLYIVQAIVLAIIRATADGPERWTVPEGTLPALVLGSVVFATVWRRLVGAGPVEAGLRALTRVALRETGRPGAGSA